MIRRYSPVVFLSVAAFWAYAADTNGPPSFRDVIAKAKPAVVVVVAARTPGKVLGDSFVDFINPFPLHKIPEDTLRFLINLPLVAVFPVDRKSLGSGFIISPDGFVLTNQHVIDRANKIEVELSDKRKLKARLVGADPFADIALLKLDAPTGESLPALPLGESDDLREGDWVLAIGHPFGLKWTATAGIVSAVGRDVDATKMDDLIQIEASLDSGNSGGPLLNEKGQVVGINTAALFMAENKGFSVPIGMAREILPDLKQNGKPHHGWLGVTVTDFTPELAEKRKLDIKQGALLEYVCFRSPARKAGLEDGDVLVEFDGKKITDNRDFIRAVRATPVGKTVQVKVYRKKGYETLNVTVGELKERLRIL